MKVSIKLYGQLYWYVQKRKELDLETQSQSIQDIIDELKLPIGEIAFVSLDGSRVELDTKLHDGAVLEIYPIIGGG